MEFERIEVLTRDEYRGAQEPTSFRWRDEHFEIERILDRWYEGHADSTRLPLRYFRVQTTDGRRFILRYHEFFMAWSLLIPREEEKD